MEINPDIYEELRTLALVINSSLESIVDAWKQLMSQFSEPIGLVSYIEIIKKRSFALVREIKPNKLIIVSKKLSVYYCRNNC